MNTGCFHILAVIHNAAMSNGVGISVFIFYRYIPRVGIAGSYSDSIFLF